ncbi:hypothetical protein M5689_009554 [Euphorbia peplus]|nr:hypothetical protein M5689_009554 [Euphorbia peplus]
MGDMEDVMQFGLTLEEADMALIAPVKKCSILGRFLTERTVRTRNMPSFLADLWQHVKGVSIEILGQNLFRFDFYHPWERERILKGSPWTYDQHLLLMAKMEDDIVQGDEELNRVDLWVQIYDLPRALCRRKLQ